MIKACSQQVRTLGLGGVYGLDFNAVLAFASHAGLRAGVESTLLTDALPTVERLVVAGLRKDDTE